MDGRKKQSYMVNNKINYNGISIEVKVVTPEFAKDVLDNHNHLNRCLSKEHVKALLNNMKQGTWRFNGDSIRFDKDGELIDGQHRLAAIKEFGKPLPMITIYGFDSETMKTIDQEIKPRSLKDLFKIDGAKNSNNLAACINRYFSIKNGRSFLSTNRSGLGYKGNSHVNAINTVTIDTKYNLYVSNPEFWDDITAYSVRCYAKTRLLKQSDIGGVYAYLYLDMHHSDDEIRGFFDRLCFTITDINVINLLRDILVRDLSSKSPMTSVVRSSYLIKTWNYYIKGKDVKVLSYNRNTEGIIEFI